MGCSAVRAGAGVRLDMWQNGRSRLCAPDRLHGTRTRVSQLHSLPKLSPAHRAAELERRIKADPFTAGNASVPFLPPEHTYKYLGAHISMTLNWGEQFKRTYRKAAERGQLLAASLASPAQCLRVIQQSIAPGIIYALSTMAYTPQERSAAGAGGRPGCRRWPRQGASWGRLLGAPLGRTASGAHGRSV
jgi:hypothetical protein